jgi:hypothetical protein
VSALQVEPVAYRTADGLVVTEVVTLTHRAPILCAQVAIMGWYAECLACGIFEIDPEQFLFSGADEAPPVAAADFEAAKASGSRLGFIAAAGDTFRTIEFPGMLARPSRLWIRSTHRHKLYGNGLLATLELPVPLDQKGLPETADELNSWELRGPDLPPLFGAWCIGPRAPAFTSFIPNRMCVPGIELALAHRMQLRHSRVCQWLNAPLQSRLR